MGKEISMEERDEYDDCTVALIGRRYRMIGYDFFEAECPRRS